MRKQYIKLNADHRQYLQELQTQNVLSFKARQLVHTLLELDQGNTIVSVAEKIGVSYQTIARWRKVYKEEGLNPLLNEFL